jgi:hypothetical protein
VENLDRKCKERYQNCQIAFNQSSSKYIVTTQMLSEDELLRLIKGKPFEEKYVSHEEISEQMEMIRKVYNVDKSHANLEETRKILKKIGSLSDKVVEMRDENR